MVENSSPRAQLFMQVRPLPGSMVPVNAISAACAWSGRPTWDEAHSAQTAHLPGLISPETGSACSSSLAALCHLHSSWSQVNPSPFSQPSSQPALTSHAMLGIANLLFSVHDSRFILTVFLADTVGVQGVRGVTWDHPVPEVHGLCCGHLLCHQGWAVLAESREASRFLPVKACD